jgi:hypothetical protein
MYDRMTALLMRPDSFSDDLQRDLLNTNHASTSVLDDSPLFHFSSDPAAVLSPPPKRTKGRVNVRREIWSGNCVDFYELKPSSGSIVKKEEIE